HQRVSEGAQLPVAEMSRRHQNPSATGLRALIMLQTLILNPVVDIPGVDVRKLGERHQHPRGGTEDAIDDGLALFRRSLRKREGEVGARGTPQFGNAFLEESNEACR